MSDSQQNESIIFESNIWKSLNEGRSSIHIQWQEVSVLRSDKRQSSVSICSAALDSYSNTASKLSTLHHLAYFGTHMAQNCEMLRNLPV